VKMDCAALQTETPVDTTGELAAGKQGTPKKQNLGAPLISALG
jgi:hypothetical protein